MTSGGPTSDSRLSPLPTTAAKQRIVAAARELFVQHGIGGTSLQMIADALGVTKAAVYHQFKTKDEIVLSAAAASLVPLERAVDAAEAESCRARALDLLLTQYVDIAVYRRHYAAILQNDPVMVRFVSEHGPFRQLIERFSRLLITDDTDAARVRAAMVSAGVNAAAIHPLLIDLDDDALRVHLLRLARLIMSDEDVAE